MADEINAGASVRADSINANTLTLPVSALGAIYAFAIQHNLLVSFYPKKGQPTVLIAVFNPIPFEAVAKIVPAMALVDANEEIDWSTNLFPERRCITSISMPQLSTDLLSKLVSSPIFQKQTAPVTTAPQYMPICGCLVGSSCGNAECPHRFVVTC